MRLRWPVRLAPRETRTLRWSLRAEVEGAPLTAAPDSAAGLWKGVGIEADDRRLAALAERSLGDLEGLLMAPEGRPGEVFAAAGAPWFFTLFGRDSIWAARLMLPFGWQLAAGTLRVLAALQGTKYDAETDGGARQDPARAAPRLRSAHRAGPARRARPAASTTGRSTPRRCGSACCTTPGGPACRKTRSGPCCRAAGRPRWIAEYGDADGDGFLEYIDHSGRGLSNQGWKDSGDSIRFADGAIAARPVALCEVQGYAYEAAWPAPTC